MQNQCAEIKIRAERRVGELLAEQDMHGGDRKSDESKLQPAALKDMGIEKTQSHRWQAIAGIPENSFEGYIK